MYVVMLLSFIGPWTKVISIIQTYTDDELDFAIDISTVSNLTGLNSEDSKSLINLLSKNDTGL
jgi:hypothetical protein